MDYLLILRFILTPVRPKMPQLTLTSEAVSIASELTPALTLESGSALMFACDTNSTSVTGTKYYFLKDGVNISQTSPNVSSFLRLYALIYHMLMCCNIL